MSLKFTPLAIAAQLLFGLAIAVLPAGHDNGSPEPPAWNEDWCPEWLCEGQS